MDHGCRLVGPARQRTKRTRRRDQALQRVSAFLKLEQALDVTGEAQHERQSGERAGSRARIGKEGGSRNIESKKVFKVYSLLVHSLDL